jgi:hypothetical protein
MKSLFISFLSLAAAVSLSNAQVVTMARTVPSYDPLFPNPNQVDVKLPSAPWYAAFTANVAAAWGVDRGGVVNFDHPETVPWPTPLVGTHGIRASYGVSHTQWFSTSIPLLGDIGNHAPVVPVSGRGDMMSKYPGHMALKFSTTTGPIRQAGLTVLQHPQITQKVTVHFIQAFPGAVITYTFLIPAGPSNRDTFCGATATVPGGIIGVRIQDLNAYTGGPARLIIDDLAFVTKYPVIVADPRPVTTVGDVRVAPATSPDAGKVAR